jgi:type II secretion system (T2SS) protein F
MSNRVLSWSSWFYSLLIKAYPKTFRGDYAQEMLWCFEDMYADALKKDGKLGLVGLWLRILPDWGMTVIKEHLQALGYRKARQMETTQFNNQLTSTLALFSRALRSGYSVKQAFEIIAEHAPEPTKSAFKRVAQKIEEGIDAFQAFAELGEELNSSYWNHAVAVMTKQRAEGGNLADRLDEVNRELYKELGDEAWAKSVDLDDGYDFEEYYPLK